MRGNRVARTHLEILFDKVALANPQEPPNFPLISHLLAVYLVMEQRFLLNYKHVL